MHSTSYAEITPVSDRTSQVRDAIITAAGVNTAADVTDAHLATIISLNLRAKSISALKSGDFSGMTGLTDLNLYGNQLSSLPNGIFEGLTALTTLRLGGNTVDPMPITVSLEKVGDNQFKAVAPIGAPFAIVLPISATNGSIADSTTLLTIAKGSTESSAITVSRTADTTAAVTANIGTLPGLPQNHYGYILSKSSALPVEIISEVVTTTPIVPEPIVPEPVVPETSTNTAPVFTDGVNTIRTIAENAAAATNIGTAVGATDADDDTLIYSLSGTDASAFDIDSSSGQVKTKTTLDYETKRIYTLIITVSDGNLTDTIAVVVSVIDVAETTLVLSSLPVSDRTPAVRDAIVAAVPNISTAADVTDTHLAAITALNLRSMGITALQSGDFAGLTGLTNLNLYGNMLSGLPYGIFDGLTSLTTLRLGGNLVDPMPLIVSLQQVTAGQFKVIISEGAPFDTTIPVNGSTITISKGSTESATFTSTTSVSIGALPSLPANHFGYVLAKSAICNRTTQVAEAIAAMVPNVPDCNNVTEVDLARITSLNLSSMSITSLASDDFAGLLSLATLDLSNNQFSSLPAGIFDGLTTLTTVNLSGNSVSPLPFSVSLQKVGSDQIKVVVPTGAPFDMMLPISVANGSLSSGVALTIPIGSVESSTQTITRTSGTTAAVTVDIGTIPNLPSLHSGYGLVKSNQQPLEIFSSINVAPVFTEGTSTARTIAENTAADTNIGSAVSATDADDDTLTYRLSGIDAASFSIVSTSGQLKTKATLDYETKISYSVTITVSDGNLTDTISVTINITDIDENRAPVFSDGESTTRSVAENTGSGVNIGTAVSATDADDDTLTYTLAGTDASSVSIDSTSGQLRTKSALDYETKASYSVTITVSDGDLTDTIDVTINVTDVDETPAVTTKDNEKPNNAPVFTDGNSTTRTVAENTAPGVDIGSAVSATDDDKDDTLTYSLGGTDESSFSIDSSSGQLRTSATLDYEAKDSYSVTITVSDGKGGNDTISVTINITNVDESAPNNAPTFDDGESTTRTVAENTASGVDIGSAVSATDDDKDDTLTYSLGGTDVSSFSIDSSSGQLRTSATLDYEAKDSYSVTITVSDGKGGNDTISVTINITNVDESAPNNAPTFDDGESTTRTVAENTASGVDIGSAVSATDADDDTLSYSLGGTDESSFSIDSSSGQLRTSATLDYEAKDSYSVTITVSDGKGGSDTISVTINITDVDETVPNNAPTFTDGESTTRTVAEDTATDTNIGSAITATDADNDTLTYSLSGTNESSFEIVSSSGQLKTKDALNHETKSSYVVTISVSDGEGGSDSISVTINVTNVNEAPVFSDGTTTTRAIAENVGANINIGTAVKAADPDTDDSLTYTLGGTNAASFAIDDKTGQLKTNAALDFETKTVYSVTITVSDGSLTDTITVTITVTNLDETPSNIAPVFDDGDSTTRSIAENTPADRNIGAAVSATDTDSNTLAYLLSGDDASSFDIVSTTGQLKTNAALNYEDKDTYQVKVSVLDGSSTDTIDVTINVTDVNEAPVFADDSTTLSVAENTAASTNIGSAITATDPDGDDLTYSLEGSDAASFDIVSTTGQLKTKAALDYEDETSYSVTLKAADDNLSDTISVTINVTNVDENRAPAFVSASTTRSVAENTGSGVNIGDAVSATDADDDTLEYTLSGTDASSFDIGGTNGQLRTKASLDYETKRSYSVTVTVKDRNGGTDSIAVTITVTNVDENRAPAFASASTTRSVTENTASGTSIGDAVSATDADNNTLIYTLNGNDAASFDIDDTNGQLQTKAALDFETKTSYSVTITASDGKKSDSITVTITVTNVDENRAPAFASESTTRSVAENTASGTSIGDAVSATDADNNTLIYTLNGNDAASFDIDDTNGQLQTKSDLDFETKSSYSVTITASDGKKSDSITVTITVTNVDENRAPTFLLSDFSYSITDIANASVGDDIGSAVTATDADNDTLEYSVGGDDTSYFSIDSSSGQLQVTQALIDGTSSSYSIKVIASDGNGGSAEISGTIYVTRITDVNDAPEFDEGSTTTRSVDKGTYPSQDLGGPVSATDDDDDTLEYSLGGTDAALFEIDSTNGQLSNRNFLHYDDKTSYSVTITVSDSNGGTDTITVTITDDKSPAIEILTFIRQNEPNWVLELDSGTGVVSAVIPADDRPQSRDSDVASFTRPPGVQFDNSFIVSISFDEEVSGLDQTELTLTENTAGANVTSWEALMGWTGNNTVTQYRATVEVTQSGTVTFSVAAGAATDGSGNSNADAVSKSVTVTITLTDYPPWDVNEDGSVDATDSALVTAAIGQTGEAIVNSRTDVNWDDTVDADDVTLVTYHIETDQDENRAPTFTGSISFSISDIASASVGDSIGDPVTATDADNDTLSYSVGGDDASYFSIDSSGQLKVTQALIDGTSSSYAIKVIATDPSDATAAISGTINVTRVLRQVLNSAPEFDGTSTTRSVAENTASGQNIGETVTATDANTSDTLEYTLGGTDAASFSIVDTSGQLQTSAALDYETKDSYSVTVSVSDGNGGSDSIDVTINVTGVNDAPVFTYGSSSISFSVNKGSRLGVSIYATDDDDDTLTYSLGGTDASLFSFDSDYENYLQSNSALDYDGKSSYSVTITVSDGKGGSDTIAVTITDPVPEVIIFTDVGYSEPDYVLKLDSETGIVRVSIPGGIHVTSTFEANAVTYNRARGVKFLNDFIVTIWFSETVSGFEQSELSFTTNTAGASIYGWQGGEEAWNGFLYTATIEATQSGKVVFNIAAGVASDSAGNLNTAADEKTFTVTINLTEYPPWDVNEDGSVDATDSALVTAALGQTGDGIVNTRTDVNWDGTVDADDVTLVTYHIADDGGAPSLIGAFFLLDKKTLEKLDPVVLQKQLDILRTESDGSPRYLRAIALLESVLAAIRPSKTQLLANFPNPFNPETWIPYHLANPSNVRISIYNMQGIVVRRLELGHQPAGYYTSSSRAAYWDGTNNHGERVTSGVYFYQLQADNVSLLRKMVILK